MFLTFIQWFFKVVDSLAAIASVIIAFLTFKNTSNIKDTVAVRISQENFWNNKKELNDKLTVCLNIVQSEQKRPANDPNFTQNISYVLSELERYFSLDTQSSDYRDLMNIKQKVYDMLKILEVDDIQSDIRKNTGHYGNLIGKLQELINNGRINQ